MIRLQKSIQTFDKLNDLEYNSDNLLKNANG